MKSFKKFVTKSQRKFVKHKWIFVCVKKNPFTPYKKSFFNKIIADSKSPLENTKYRIYIHETYMTIKSRSLPNFESIKVALDDKLWIELYLVFKIDTDDSIVVNNSDDEPI